MTATDTTTRPAAGAGAPRRGGRRTRLGDGLSPMRAVPMLPAPPDALHLDVSEGGPQEAVTALLAALGQEA